MVSRLVKQVGPFSITQDEKGLYTLLDPNAREVCVSADLAVIEASADFMLNPVAIANAAQNAQRGQSC